jgi:hypothetical protein
MKTCHSYIWLLKKTTILYMNVQINGSLLSAIMCFRLLEL